MSSADWARLIEAESGAEPLFLRSRSREFRISRLSEELLPEFVERGTKDSSSGGVGSLLYRLNGRRGMGRNKGGPPSP